METLLCASCRAPLDQDTLLCPICHVSLDGICDYCGMEEVHAPHCKLVNQ